MVVISPATWPGRILFLHLPCFFLLLCSFNFNVPEAAAAASTPTSFSMDFGKTSSYRLQDLRFEGDASMNYNDNLVDLTCNSKEAAQNIFCRGRMSYNHPVPFYDNSTGEVASFFTQFTFAIKLNGSVQKGDGMAFFLSGYPSALPTNSAGSLIGLADSSNQTVETVLAPSRFVAVEFDTYNNPWDPTGSSDHIGIDLSSVTSVSATRLTSYSLNGTMTATITFDGSTRMLAASLNFDDNPSLGTAQVKTQLPKPLHVLLPPEVAVGFSAGTGGYFELHQILSWSFNSTMPRIDSSVEPKGANNVQPKQGQALGTKGSHTVAMVIGLVVVLVVAASLAACWFWCRRYKSRRQHKTQEPTGQNKVILGTTNATTTPSSASTEKENGQQDYSKVDVPRHFPYEELAQATCNFNKNRKLGQGAFGAVYEGTLAGIHTPVAIKDILETSSDQTKKAFDTEVKIMSQLHHRNILSLKGWCDEDKHLLLIYEKMENGSLEDHLYPKNGTMDTAVYCEKDNGTRPSSHLSWLARHNILIGIASGLAYLHKECRAAIVHRDLKPANVMLDKKFNAKLADFGLVTQVRHTQTSRPTDNVIGTQSYIDPAYRETGKVSGQCDVYSLGVVLLEIVCGTKPSILQGSGKNSLIEMVRECDGRNRILDAADKGLRGQFDKEIEVVLRLGLQCVLPDRHNRPHAGRVRDRLTELLENGKGLAASTSQPSEEEFRMCTTTFPTHSLADEEAGVSPLLSR